jgi:class 3 adenylate cyclase/tetratricopeptide (TPR) repeat protein
MDEPQSAGSRKTVTILFSDLVGSTALGEQLDPESLGELMNRYFEEFREMVERHGGIVEKYVGDALMAVFGLAEVHEDDALRAVRAAWDMKERLPILNQELESRWGVRLSNRTGVNTMKVLARDHTGGQRMVAGDAVNVAARLEQAAPEGEILLGDLTHRLVRDQVEARPLGLLALKGKSAPVAASILLGLRAGTPARGSRLAAPLIGREKELARLLEVLDDVARRRCRLVTVLGPPGVGKSRLMDEVAIRAEESMTIFRGRCPAYGEGVTFQPVRDVLEKAIGFSAPADLGEARRRLQSLVRDDPEAEVVTERVGAAAGFIDAEFPLEEMQWAVWRTFHALARLNPTLMVFDDIHWAEPPFLDLLESIPARSQDVPLMVLCAARLDLLDSRPGWGNDGVSASLRLDDLPAAASERLVNGLLGTADLSGVALERLITAAGGNPFFVEQMLSMLIDDGVLQRSTHGWTLIGDLSSMPIPPTISALLATRLARLGWEERVLLERASIVGEVFSWAALRHLAPQALGPKLERHVLALTNKQFVQLDQGDTREAGNLRFAHALIRDATYHGILKRSRAELHRRFADWLEAEDDSLTFARDELIGFHLEQGYRHLEELGPVDEAGRAIADRAARHLASAGRRALGIGNLPACADLLERSASLIPKADLGRVEVLLYLGEALLEMGEFSRTAAIVSEGMVTAGTAPQQALQGRFMLLDLLLRTHTDPAFSPDAMRDAVEALLPTFEANGDDGGLARAWTALGTAHWALLQSARTEEALERAVEHARRAGDRRTELEVLALHSGVILWGATPVPDGIRRCKEILDSGRGDRNVESHMFAAMAGLMAMAGRCDEGRRLAARSHVMLEELGRQSMAAVALSVAGMVELMCGDAIASEKKSRDALNALERIGDRYWVPTAAEGLFDALYAQGRFDDADHFADLTSDGGFASPTGDALHAKLLAQRRRFSEAERLAREALSQAMRTDMPSVQADTMMALAEVLALAGRPKEAVPLVHEAVRLYEARGALGSAGRARVLLGQLDPVSNSTSRRPLRHTLPRR